MDPIIVVGPDGVENEFPAGTDDATISRAMAEAYPVDQEAQAAPGAEGAPAADAPDPATASDGTRWNDNDGDGNIDYRNSWQGVNEAQAQAWADQVNAGQINPNFPPGTNENPFVIPENMPDEQIQDLIERGVTYIDREGRTQRKADDLYGVYVGAARPAINTMNWLENGVQAVEGALGGEGWDEGFHDWRLENTRYATQEGYDELEALSRQAGARPGRGGQLAGAVAATAPLALATRNPWLVGAGEGALSSNADDAMGLARDTAIGAVVGKGSDVALRGLGAMIDPQIAAPTRRLLDEGVELSPGQLAGGLAHRLEDATTGVPGIGELPNAAQRRAQESVVRVAAQRPLTSIGVELPRNLQTGHEIIDYTQRAVGDAYDELIPQLDVRLDQQFAQEFNALRASARNMQAPQAEMFERLIMNEIAPRFNAAMGPANGRITGESFKELESILGREVRDFSTGLASPHDRRYANAVREVQAQLRDMLARGNPAHAERLTGINDAYRQLAVLEDAANRAPAGARGRFTPEQLNTAARNADPSVRRRAAARGDALFMDLSQDAGEIMARTVNDSGTATRGVITAGLGAAFLNQSLNISVNPWAVGALAFGAIPYNRTGNRLFTAAMANRPEWAGTLRGALDGNRQFGVLGSVASNQVERNEGRMERDEANMAADERNRWMAVQERMEASGLGSTQQGPY